MDAPYMAYHTLGVEAVHHRLDNVELFLNGKVDKVGVQDHLVGRHQGRIVLEEERRGHLLYMADLASRLLFLPLPLSLLDRLATLSSYQHDASPTPHATLYSR